MCNPFACSGQKPEDNGGATGTRKRDDDIGHLQPRPAGHAESGDGEAGGYAIREQMAIRVRLFEKEPSSCGWFFFLDSQPNLRIEGKLLQTAKS